MLLQKEREGEYIMIYTIKKPAGNKVSAWELKEEGRAVRYFGNLTA